MPKLKKAVLETVESRVSRIGEILDEMKAVEIVALDLRGISDFTDFFVIATMQSSTQMRSALLRIEQELKAEGVRPFVPPELESPKWTVLDYGSVVVHLFDADARRFYALEELWGDGAEFEWQNQALA